MMLQQLQKSTMFGLFVLFLISCYPGGSVFEEELDVVVTLYDEEYNFDASKQYILVDSVVSIGERDRLLTERYNRQILDQVRNELNLLGYQEIQNPEETPDVVVLLSKVTSTNIEAYSIYPVWWAAWGWYPGWPYYGAPIGPGWYPAYPWGGGTVVYSYTTGTLIMEMVTPKKANTGDQTLPVVWTAAINGLLEGSEVEIQGRLDQSIHQAFDQSPYLQ